MDFWGKKFSLKFHFIYYHKDMTSSVNKLNISINFGQPKSLVLWFNRSEILHVSALLKPTSQFELENILTLNGCSNANSCNCLKVNYSMLKLASSLHLQDRSSTPLNSHIFHNSVIKEIFQLVYILKFQDRQYNSFYIYNPKEISQSMLF